MRESQYLDASEKVCSRCGETLPRDAFVRRTESRGGDYKGWCRQCDAERSRVYYRANRERILEAAAARRGGSRAEALESCSECGAELVGKQRLTCGSSACRDARFKRLHPEAYAAREAAKVERRREARRRARENVPAE